MFTRVCIAGALGILLSLSVAQAQKKNIDLKDYDDDLMHDVERAMKFFEPDITAKNQSHALDDAGVIQDGFTYAKDYFSKKEGAEDAVKIAADGLTLVNTAIASLKANDFAAATEAARQIPNTCKACHEVYKPLQKQ